MSEYDIATPEQKRVVVVDDSQTMRKWLRLVIEADPRMSVVGEAEDAHEAREVIRTLTPDVVILDIVMPKMDGLDFLERLMRLFPLPVVVLSSLASHDPRTKARAMSLGAVDCLAKPAHASDVAFREDFQNRVFSAAIHAAAPVVAQPVTPSRIADDGPLILIGASTGGVTALEEVLNKTDPDGPPIIIVQHMPEKFLFSFVSRLNESLRQNVRLADENSPALPGEVIFAPSNGQHTEVVKRQGKWICAFGPNTEQCVHVPSVDRLFSSAVPFGGQVIAVILTGLGKDGAIGMTKLKVQGAKTIGQDERTSTVYGMPRAAFECGAVEKQLPLDQIGKAVNDAVAQQSNDQTERRHTP
jgi:two-component system chemotaxis response regulator CheB